MHTLPDISRGISQDLRRERGECSGRPGRHSEDVNGVKRRQGMFVLGGWGGLLRVSRGFIYVKCARGVSRACQEALEINIQNWESVCEAETRVGDGDSIRRLFVKGVAGDSRSERRRRRGVSGTEDEDDQTVNKNQNQSGSDRSNRVRSNQRNGSKRNQKDCRT